MERYRALLRRTQVSVVSAEIDPELDAVARTITGSVRVNGRGELAGLFVALLAAQGDRDPVAKTLDLYGHSTARTAQLRLGDWVVDATSADERAFFGELAEREVLPRLGITSVRLLACRTAATEAGRATLCMLAALLGVEVYGTPHLLYDAHHDEQGFIEAWRFLLVSASELRPRAPPADPAPRRLELDALPCGPVAPSGWPRRVVTAATVEPILALVDRDAGAAIAGAAGAPSWVLLLPARTQGTFHLAHVLFDGAFVGVYPDGPDAAGVVYPVRDPAALQRIIATLPSPAN